VVGFSPELKNDEKIMNEMKGSSNIEQRTRDPGEEHFRGQ
jgi:hypothetical protein